jgi:hypothetical protein
MEKSKLRRNKALYRLTYQLIAREPEHLERVYVGNAYQSGAIGNNNRIWKDFHDVTQFCNMCYAVHSQNPRWLVNRTPRESQSSPAIPQNSTVSIAKRCFKDTAPTLPFVLAEPVRSPDGVTARGSSICAPTCYLDFVSLNAAGTTELRNNPCT